MYTSPDEARSDLFLAGAVYVLGRFVLDLLLDIVPLLAVPVLRTVLLVVLPFTYTGLVPLLLVRYRKEPWAMYGLGHGPDRTFWLGVLAGAPIVAASAAAYAVDTALSGAPNARVATYLPAVAVGDQAVVALLASLSLWLGLALLGVFTTVKARDAFRGDYTTVRDGMRRIGKVLGIAAAALALLLLLTPLFVGDLNALLYALVLRVGLPLGVAAGVVLVYRRLRGPSSTTRQTLLTPTVVFALGPFLFSFDAQQLLNAAFLAVLAAAIGLVVGALQESRRSGLGAFGLALVIALGAGAL